MAKTMWIVVAVAVAGVACGKGKKAGDKKEGGGAETAAKTEGAGAEGAAPAPETETMKLDAIGVTATVPAGSRAQPFNKGVRITAMTATVDVEVAEESFPKTAAEMQEGQKMLGSSFEPSTLPDGWVLRYQSSGSYLLMVQREIGGKRINCGTNGSKPERVDAALEICKSLAP